MSHPRIVVRSALAIGFVLGLAGFVAPLPQLAVAQQAATKTTLITLGTQGGPLRSKSRSQPANVLLVNDEPYIIDAGNGVAGRLAMAGVPLGRVGQIFITHNHDDHNADLGTMMGLAWTLGRSTTITVHGPKGTRDIVDGFLKFFSANRTSGVRTFPISTRPCLSNYSTCRRSKRPVSYTRTAMSRLRRSRIVISTFQIPPLVIPSPTRCA